jgi:hypothetical protein
MPSQDCDIQVSRHTVKVDTPKPNGSDTAPSPPPGSTAAHRSQLRQTLFIAGVFALLAMIYVPAPAQQHPFSRAHYRFIFSQDETGIAFFQLLVNVVFAALLGAILANIRWQRQRKPKAEKPRPEKPTRDRIGAIIFLVAAGVVVALGILLTLPYRAKHTEKVTAHVSADPNPGLTPKADHFQTSQHASASDFAKDALKLRENALVNVKPLSEPTTLHPSIERFPWKTNIVTTVFWIGEAQRSSGPKGHIKSEWDNNWTTNYGGTDTPDAGARRNYIPIAFIPKQNPFYCALPYNDVTHGQFKPEAPLVIPWFKHEYRGPGQSVCRDRWIAIRKGNRTCYAQWEDCGPFRTDHFQYVFGNERPAPNPNHGAGLDVSPAVRDYLGLAPTDVIDWQFVEVRDVPPGPWRSYGENNHFVIARRQMEQNSQPTEDSPKN